MTAFDDILATHDPHEIRAALPSVSPSAARSSLDRALRQGWDGAAAEVIRGRPDVLTANVWKQAWAFRSRQSAEALLTLDQPWPTDLDLLEATVAAGWPDLLAPLLTRATPAQIQATEALGLAIQSGQPTTIELLLPRVPLWGSHLVTALEHGHVTVFDRLWGKVPRKEVHDALESHVALGYYDHRVDVAETVVDPIAARLAPAERRTWLAWAEARGLPLAQTRSMAHLQGQTGRFGPGGARPRQRS